MTKLITFLVKSNLHFSLSQLPVHYHACMHGKLFPLVHNMYEALSDVHCSLSRSLSDTSSKSSESKCWGFAIKAIYSWNLMGFLIRCLGLDHLFPLPLIFNISLPSSLDLNLPPLFWWGFCCKNEKRWQFNSWTYFAPSCRVCLYLLLSHLGFCIKRTSFERELGFHGRARPQKSIKISGAII